MRGSAEDHAREGTDPCILDSKVGDNVKSVFVFIIVGGDYGQKFYLFPRKSPIWHTLSR